MAEVAAAEGAGQADADAHLDALPQPEAGLELDASAAGDLDMGGASDEMGGTSDEHSEADWIALGEAINECMDPMGGTSAEHSEADCIWAEG